MRNKISLVIKINTSTYFYHFTIDIFLEKEVKNHLTYMVSDGIVELNSEVFKSKCIKITK